MGGRDRILARVIIGHDSSLLPEKNELGHSLQWNLFVRAANGKKIEKNYISKIVFFLHETYGDKAERTLRDAPFEISETGYGSFNPEIRIYFAYPGAKPVKINYEMILFMADNGHNEQEVTCALKDCPTSFLDMIRKYSGDKKKKRESEESVKDLRDTLFPLVLKKPKLLDDSSSARSSPKLSPKDGIKVSPKDKDSKEKDGSKTSPGDKEVKEKDRQKEKDKDKDRKEKKKEKKDKDRDKERSKDKKKDKHAEKDREKKRSKDRASTKTPDELKPPPSPPRPSAAITPPPTLVPEPPIVPPPRPPTLAPEAPILPPSRPKVAPIKCEDRKKPLESDSCSSMSISSPSSMGSPASSALTCVEIQRRISSLTNEEQIFKVACILLSCEGSQLLMPKLALSFDMDLSSADPALIDRLSKALQ